MAHTIEEIKKIRNGRGTSAASSSDSTKTRSTGHSIEEIRRLGGKNVYTDSEGYTPTKASAPIAQTRPEYRYNSIEEYDKALKEIKPKTDFAKRALNAGINVFNGLSGIGLDKNAAMAPIKTMPYTEEELAYNDLKTERNLYAQEHAFDEYKKYQNEADYAKKSQESIEDYLKILDSNNTDQTYSRVYNAMTDEEKAMANYLASNNINMSLQESNRFKDYMMNMRASVDKRSYDEKVANANKEAENLGGKIGLSAKSVGENLVSSVGTGGEYLASYLGGWTPNPYGGASGLGNLAMEEREAVSKDMGNVGSFLYNTGMSVADSALGAYLFGEGYASLMGTNAFNTTYKDLYEKGASQNEILLGALSAGAAETIFEKVSLDRLLKPKSITAWHELIAETLKQAGVEASEETFTELANIFSDEFVNGPNSEVSIRARELKTQGLSDDEIAKIVSEELRTRIIEAAAGGALSGGMMSGLFNGSQFRQNRRIGSNVDRQEFKDSLDTETQHDLEEKYGENWADEVSDAQMGAIYRDVVNKEEAFKIDTDINVSDTTTLNGEEAKLTGFTKIGDRVVLNTDKGRADLKDIKLSKNDAQIVTIAEGIKDDRLANAFVKNYGGEDVSDYDMYARYLYEAGKVNADWTQNIDLTDRIISTLGKDKANALYEAGQMSDVQDLKFLKTAYDVAVNEMKSQNIRKGDFAGGSFDSDGNFVKDDDFYRNLSRTKKRIYLLCKAFADFAGVNVQVINDDNVASENGHFVVDRPDGGTVMINLAARPYGDSAYGMHSYVIDTLSHELTHWMRGNNQEGYTILEKAISEHLKSKGVYDDLIKNEIESHKKAHPGEKFSEADALEEVVARGCEDMLDDPKTMREVLSTLDVNSLEKLRIAFDKWFERIETFIEKLMSGFESPNETIKYLRDEYNTFRKLWVEGIQGAIKNAQTEVTDVTNITTKKEVPPMPTKQGNFEKSSNEKISNNGQNVKQMSSDKLSSDQKIADERQRNSLNNVLNKVGVEVEDSYAYPKYSLKTWRSSEYSTDAKTAAEALANSMGITVKEAEQYIKDVGSIASQIANDQDRLDYASIEGKSAWVSNPEYGGSLDYSFLCPKRLTYTGTMNAILAKQNDLIFSVDDFLYLRRALIAAGYEAPCSFCFVESARARFGKYNAQFIDLAKEEKLAYIPTAEELSNPDKLEEMRSEHPETFKRYEKFLNSLSQRKPKMLEERRPYNGDILKAFQGKENTIIEKNLHGGIRFNSFSDFETVHMIDCMQAIMDMSRVGLAGFGYTKQKAFAQIFGKTGLKIDMSCVAKGVTQDGKHIIFDDVEGMNHKDALKLRNGNVGIVCVVFTDDQVRAALCDERIDYVLPFHRSQWSKKDYEKMGLSLDTKDYTRLQTEKLGTKKAKEGNIPFLSYWNENQTGEETVQRYLDIINEQNKTPIFPFILEKDEKGNWIMPKGKRDHNGKLLNKKEEIKELAAKNYWKLLTEYKMYENDGTPIGQYPVKPIFDMDAANELLTKYDGSHKEFPVSEKVVEDFMNYKKTGESELLPKWKKYSDKLDTATFKGKKFWSGSVSLTDGTIEEVHTYEEAEIAGFHHTFYFSEAQVEKMDDEENAFFFINNGRVEIWKDEIPDWIIGRIEEQIKLNKKYSDKLDSEGNKLTEEQAEFFKDSKIVDANGNLKVEYHGTDADFFTFNTSDFGGKNGTAEGYGIYFTDDQEITSKYGDRQLKGYVNITKPAYSTKKTISSTQLAKLIKELCENQAEQMVSDGEYDNKNDAIKDTWVSNYEYTYDKPMSAVYKLVANNILETNSNDMSIIQEVMFGYGAIQSYKMANEFYAHLKRLLGFDGFVTYWTWSNGQGESEIVVAFDSNQFKLADNMNPTKSDDIRYSDKLDSVYMEAVEKGDLTLAQQMVDQAAKSAGYTIKGYHGTENYGFKVFDPNKSDDRISLFFTTNKGMANTYVGDESKIYETYLKVTNPYVVDAHGSKWNEIYLDEDMNKLPKEVRAIYEYGTFIRKNVDSNVDYTYVFDQLGEAEESARYLIEEAKENGSPYSKEREEEFIRLAQKVDKVYEEWDEDEHLDEDGYPQSLEDYVYDHKISTTSTRKLAKYAKENGYDGLIIKNVMDNGKHYQDIGTLYESEVVVVFDSDQVKSADAVTYDDNGNIIPLSERFDSNQKDIRYSDKLDSTYMDAVDNKRMAEADILVEQAAKEAGYNYKAFHGTFADFTEFDLDKANEDSFMGRGFYFTSNENEAKNTYASFEGGDVQDKIDREAAVLLDQWGYGWDASQEFPDEYNHKLMKYTNDASYWKKVSDKESDRLYNKAVKEVKESLTGKGRVMPVYLKLENPYIVAENDTRNPYEIIEEVNKGNHDGIIDYSMAKRKNLEKGTIHYVVLKPNQVKSAETVVYDENKNIIPLSERFNANNNDTRYSEKLDLSDATPEVRERVRELEKQVGKLTKENDALKAAKVMAAEKAQKEALMSKIIEQSKTLGKWLLTDPKANPVPQALRKPIINLLRSIDYTTSSYAWRKAHENEYTKKDQSMAVMMGRINHMLHEIDQDMVNDPEAYDMSQLDWLPAFNKEFEQITNAISEAEKASGEKFNLQQMSVEDLDTLNKLIGALKTSVHNMNKVFGEHNKESVSDLGKEMISYLENIGLKDVDNALTQFMEIDNTTPYYFFKRLGPSGQKLFRILMDAQGEYAFKAQEIEDYAKDVFKGKDVIKWREIVKEFDITEVKYGKSSIATTEEKHIKMTVPQIMSLYCLAKRDQALRHISSGGIKIATFKDGKNEVRQLDNVTLSESDLKMITSTLTDEQKEVADKLQEFLSTTCSKWGNEVTMQRFGYKAYTEKNYFPINVDQNVLTKEARQRGSSLYQLLNMGFTKPLNPKARNPIEIFDIFETFTIHSTDMAQYNAFALPILNVIRVWNYKEVENLDTEQSDWTATKENVERDTGEEAEVVRQKYITVKGSIEKAIGKKGNHYIGTLLADLNGDVTHGRADWLDKFSKNYKTAAVAANMQVVLLQPMSYIRAGYAIDNKYLVKAVAMKSNPELIKKYCGIAVWKDMGFYNLAINNGLAHKIMQDDSTKDKLIDKTLWLAGKMDEFTWRKLWNACELEIRDTTKLEVGSEKYYQAVGDRLTDLIFGTQVVDSVLTKSELMRGQDTYTKMLTAFNAEPTLGLNIVMDAAEMFDQDRRANGTQHALRTQGANMRKAASVYLAGSLAESILRAVWGRIRNYDGEEDDETLLHEILTRFLQELNPLRKIPFVKDLYGILYQTIAVFRKDQYKVYADTRMDEASIEALANAIAQVPKVIEKQEITYKDINKIAKGIDATGIPVSNTMRIFKGIWNNTIGRIWESALIK